MSKSQLTEVTNDLFDISSRLKSINPNYKIYHNAQTDKFEVHDVSRPRGATLAFTVPYRELDSRTLDYARFTRVQNAERLLAEVEEHNRKLEREEVYCAQQRLISAAQEVARC